VTLLPRLDSNRQPFVAAPSELSGERQVMVVAENTRSDLPKHRERALLRHLPSTTVDGVYGLFLDTFQSPQQGSGMHRKDDDHNADNERQT
jgi:hypothetical protein